MGEHICNTFDELCSMLYARTRVRNLPTLEPVRQAYDALSQYIALSGLSQPHYVHVLGTNGKGSTSTYIASLCHTHGIITGLFTSPHLVTLRERIMLSGIMCTEQAWLCAHNIIEMHCVTEELVFFEYIFLIAIYLFSFYNARVAVMEAGLGGKYDATSILPSCVQCITPIHYDHEDILGDSLIAIAEQKAGGISYHSKVCSAPQIGEVKAVLKEYVTQGIVFSTDEIHYELGLKGRHQHINANLAYCVWNELYPLLDIVCQEDKVLEGYQQAYIAGRLQEIALTKNITLLLDGGHNYSGLQTLHSYCQDKDILGVIYATMYRKSLNNIIALVKDIAGIAPLYYMTLDNKRAVPYEVIQQYEPSCIPCISLKETIETLLSTQKQGYIVLCGSLYLIGEYLKEFPEYYMLK